MSRSPLSLSLVSLSAFTALAGCAEPPGDQTPTPSAIPAPTPTPTPTPSPTPALPSPSFEEDLGQVEAVAALHITYTNPLYEAPRAEFNSLALTNAPGVTGEELAEVSAAYHALFVWMEMIATDPYPPETCRIARDAAETLAERLEPMVGEGRYVATFIPHASGDSERTLYEEGVYWEARGGGMPPAGTVGGLLGTYLPLEVNPAEVIAESFSMVACLDGGIPWDVDALAMAWDEWRLGNVTLEASFTEEGALRATLSDVEVYNGEDETLETGILRGATLSSPFYDVAVTLPEEGGPQRQR